MSHGQELGSRVWRGWRTSVAVILALGAGGEGPRQSPWPPIEEKLLAMGRGAQVTPHLAPAGGGRFWLSWFDQEASGFGMRLNLFTEDGDPVFGARGLLVSDKPQQSWLQGYTLRVDAGGNATLVFTDVRTGSRQVQAYRIAQDGRFLWGPDGIRLSDEAQDVGPPQAVVAGTFETVGAWAVKERGRDLLRLQRRSAEGRLLWELELRAPDGAGCYWPTLTQSGDTSILVWEEASSSTSQLDRIVCAQAFDAAGQSPWRRALFQGVAPVYYRPPLVAPDAGGGLWAACQAVAPTGRLQGYMQHLTGEGHPSFPPSGLPLGAAPELDHVLADLQPSADGREGFALWLDHGDPPESQRDLRLEGLSGAGTRRWGGDGLNLLPQGTPATAPSPLAIRVGRVSVEAFWMDFPYSDFFNARILACTVNLQPEPRLVPVPLSRTKSHKLHFAFQALDNGPIWCVWADGRHGPPALFGSRRVP